MHIDYLIIGQGICGSFLSMEIQKAGYSFMVIDECRPDTASQIASGIINPVTGRRIVKTWLIDELMPFAWNAYKGIENWLGIECIREIAILDFFPTPQMRLAFLNRLSEDEQYLSMPENTSHWGTYLHYDFGYGMIRPSYLVDMQALLKSLRKALVNKQQLRESYFEQQHVVVKDDCIQYEDITAQKIIFCDGIKSFENRWFKNLPFAPNKGEALIVEIKGLHNGQAGLHNGQGHAGLPIQNILKKGINIIPWKDDLFWVGASNEWNFENSLPTKSFFEKTTAQLKAFCKLPFKVIDHLSAIRPATLERRPFLGLHPLYPAIGIFNGMGTKGCSLAPFFAKELVNHLTNRVALLPEVDVQRFKRVMRRNM